MEGNAQPSVGSFGEVLRRFRIEAGLTQAELAERAGLSVRGISDLERGVRQAPYRDNVRRLAEALQLSAAERSRLEALRPPARAALLVPPLRQEVRSRRSLRKSQWRKLVCSESIPGAFSSPGKASLQLGGGPSQICWPVELAARELLGRDRFARQRRGVNRDPLEVVQRAYPLEPGDLRIRQGSRIRIGSQKRRDCIVRQVLAGRVSHEAHYQSRRVVPARRLEIDHGELPVRSEQEILWAKVSCVYSPR
jgi:transcriptional regulator with XRE-family HTH domain